MLAIDAVEAGVVVYMEGDGLIMWHLWFQFFYWMLKTELETYPWDRCRISYVRYCVINGELFVISEISLIDFLCILHQMCIVHTCDGFAYDGVFTNKGFPGILIAVLVIYRPRFLDCVVIDLLV